MAAERHERWGSARCLLRYRWPAHGVGCSTPESHTTRPLTMVSSLVVAGMSPGAMWKMSWDRTARSATRPGISVPLRWSSNSAYTLRGLARGRSEAQLAAELGLSPHTVHDYVKALYRHFGVQSRAELLALCVARGG